ncbi:MAG: divalent heavy-metal cations transporter [Puniceicoccaceae bacterium 5H]|nr:MAG: divalent heavy-metal cations transporter [Puniceicoccaceae bacterium 5H]
MPEAIHTPLIPWWWSVGGILLLAAIHLFGVRLTFLKEIPRSRWLSFAGGVSVVYVFLHLMPAIAEAEEHFAKFHDELGERIPYILGLLGLLVTYGAARHGRTKRNHDQPSLGFWLHMGSFSIYNVIAGYVSRQQPPTIPILFISMLALAFHYLVVDHGLRAEHRYLYQHYGRWLLAGALIVGWSIPFLFTVRPYVLAGLEAFLAGGIILNVLKEELPKERQSKFTPFLIGIMVYAPIMVLA